jgi:hypothetical protein
VWKSRSVPFGKYCRSRPFVFSLEPRCKDWPGRRRRLGCRWWR